MDESPLVSRPFRFARSFDDAEAFAAALLGGTFEYMPVAGERFRGTLHTLQLAGLLIQVCDDAPHISRASVIHGAAAFAMPLGWTVPPHFNGIEVETCDAVLAMGGVEVGARNMGRNAWAAVSMDLALLDELREVAPPPIRAAGDAPMLRIPVSIASRLSGALRSAAELADEESPILPEQGVGDSLAASMRDLIAQALTAAAAVRPRPRSLHDALRLVRGAEEYMRMKLSEPIYTEELCAVLHVSQRRLHDAFVAVSGISPHAYLKRRRLMLARRALRESKEGATLVKSVALRHGFWHLGHFARDYGLLFGEPPSATLGGDARHGGLIVRVRQDPRILDKGVTRRRGGAGP